MTVIYPSDSSVIIKKNGTLAWRNNNPGNIARGFSSKTNSPIGSNKGFSVFPNIDTGRKAQVELLKRDYYQRETIAGAIGIYAPKKTNPTEKYIQYVTKKTGMSRDKKLSDMNPQEFEKFYNAIRHYERLTPGTEITLPASNGGPIAGGHDRTLKRVGNTVYRVENGKNDGSFISTGKKK